MSANFPVRHVLLRDDDRWEGSRTGLSVRADGTLGLDRVPAPESDLRLDGPFEVDPSGLAVDACGRIFVSDNDGNHLVMEVPECNFRYIASTELQSPAGLAVRGDRLYIADAGKARVARLHVPTLDESPAIGTGLLRPTGVAVDADYRVYVLDRGANRVLRFLADGSADAAYNSSMAAHADLRTPAFLALGEDRTLFVSDASTNAILAFDAGGLRVASFAFSAAPSAFQPRAVAIRRDRLYAADAASGGIRVLDSRTGALVGAIPRFRGPVSALAFGAGGDLFVKTSGNDRYLRFGVESGVIRRGMLKAGPLDAGVDTDWERITVDTEVPLEALATLATFESPASNVVPAAADWRSVPSLDALLARDTGPARPAPGSRRFLWVRVEVESSDGRHSPTLLQVRAHTTAPSYLDLLPRVYRRDDAPTRFVERLLALARSLIGDWDAQLDDVARRFDPATAPRAKLLWLAESLAFLPPSTLDAPALRTLLSRVPELYERRGTLAGLRDVAEIVAGVRPHIFEAYRARSVWQLGETSRLGFDTALASAAPEGLVVPGSTRTDPKYAGLRGDYYAGLDFERSVSHRTDRTIDFDATGPVTPEENGVPLDRFSVRWSGQVRPRHSETYTFITTPSSGVRLWVDGRPLLDTLRDSSAPTGSARILLDGERWYRIALEMRRRGGDPVARLEWTSRSQLREVIPASCLYSVLDDRADLTRDPGLPIDVGNAVVGASGPLAASEFGAMLFAEHAHLFTVVAPLCRGTRSRALLREVIDAEKPAHTDYHLCFPDARMRVGFQARLGIDAIVAGGPPPMRLGDAALGRDSFLE